jgi:hypothetical protein
MLFWAVWAVWAVKKQIAQMTHALLAIHGQFGQPKNNCLNDPWLSAAWRAKIIHGYAKKCLTPHPDP